MLQPAIAPVFLASEIIINIYFQLRGHEGASEQLPDDCPPSAKKSDNDCPPPPKRKKSVAPSPEEIMVSTLNILKKRTEQTEASSHRPDECEAYGMFLANKLRSNSKTTKIHVQHYISNILFSADRGEYEYVGNGMNSYSYSGYSTRPTTSRASSMPQTETPASNTSHQNDYEPQQSPETPASNTSHQNDYGSPAMSEQFMSEFGDLI